MEYHSLLNNQIKKYLPPSMWSSKELETFLQYVSDTYKSFEKDINVSEQAYRVTEEEYSTLHQKLEQELLVKKKSLDTLKITIKSITNEDSLSESEDLLHLVEYVKIQEDKRKRAENIYQNLISNMQNAVLLEDEHRDIVLVNHLFCEYFGIPVAPELLIGSNCEQSAEQSKHLFKDPQRFVDGIHTLLKEKIIRTDEILEFADGRVFRRDYIPIIIEDIYRGHLWSYSDITEKAHSENAIRIREEKYRSIIANMNLGLLEVDLDEKIQYANNSFCAMSGYELEELLGKQAEHIFGIDRNVLDVLSDKKNLRVKGVSDAYELQTKNKNGDVKWWLISGAPRFNDIGEHVGSIGIHLDITEQKLLEDNLVKSKNDAIESSRAKEQFLANMSHEIRTPLNAILGMSNQLTKTNLNTDQQFFLKNIHSAAENLLVIINDILDLSKIEAGKLSLEKIGFETKEVLSRVMQVMMHKAEEKGIGFSNSYCDTRLSKIFLGDPYRLNQVLLNLISNAIKFTHQGYVDITCKVLEETDTSQLVKISIKDTGIGMDEKFLSKLFENFSQEENSTTRNYGGTGLGMSICKQLIELMNGEITVKSEKGVGTTVYFVIRFEKGTEKDIPQKNITYNNTEQLRYKKILVTDDNEMNRLLASTILNSYGAIVEEALNGAEALQKVKNNTYDLILMDVQMPVMDGIETTTQIRSHISKTIPIIALTAFALKGDNIKCLEAGMNDYLTKPFEENIFINKILQYITKTEPQNSMLQEEKSTVPLTQTSTSAPRLYDLHQLNEIANGNKNFIQKMLQLFIEMSPNTKAEMMHALESKDLIKLKKTAHRIKPSFDNLGIESLRIKVREIENISEDADMWHKLDQMVKDFDQNLDLVLIQLQEELVEK